MTPLTTQVNRNRLTALGAVVYLVLFVPLGLREVAPPAVVSASAPPALFSAARAMEHVEAIAKEPHPVGSIEHARVRDEVERRFRELGLDVEEQATVAIDARSSHRVVASSVTNVLATLRGERSDGPCVVLVAHYDSVPTGPGAGDDGAGVAALIETARALRSGPALRNDVVFLITDAEEVGLMGARAFVAEHPLVDRAAVLVNFEARGHRGPSICFETSPGNGELIRAFAAVAPHPVANSASYEVYRRMPNDTDLTVFKRAGLHGLNFAFIGDVSHYHTALDEPARLDPRSLQHHGESALALARRFGDADLSRLDASDRVYFSVLRAFVVHYPVGLAWPLLALAVGLLGYVIQQGRRRGRLAARSILHGVLLVVATAMIGVLLTYAVLARFDVTGERPFDPTPLYVAGRIFLGLFLLTASLFAAVALQLRPRAKIDGLWAGALVAVAFVAVATTAAAPGTSYVTTWPLLFGAAGLGFVILRPRRDRIGPRAFAAACIGMAPALVLVVPVVLHLSESTSLRGAVAPVLLFILFLALVLPAVLFAMSVRRWWVPIASGAAGFAVLGAAAFDSQAGDDSPAWTSLMYVRDDVERNAYFVSLERRADMWTAGVLGGNPPRRPMPEFFPGSDRSVLLTEAPSIGPPAPAPELELRGLEAESGVRRYRFFVHVPDGARRVELFVSDKHVARLLSVATKEIGGRDAGSPPAPNEARGARLTFHAPPPDGFELELEVQGDGAVPIVLLAYVAGLPIPSLEELPPGFVLRPNVPAWTIVRTRVEV